MPPRSPEEKKKRNLKLAKTAYTQLKFAIGMLTEGLLDPAKFNDTTNEALTLVNKACAALEKIED